MPQFFIVQCVMPALHNMMIILFADNVSPTEIENMDFQQLKYWSDNAKEINRIRNQSLK